MGCCNEMDWSDCDMSAEHHPACKARDESWGNLTGNLTVYNVFISSAANYGGLSGYGREGEVYFVDLESPVYLDRGEYYLGVFLDVKSYIPGAIYEKALPDKTKIRDVRIKSITRFA